MTAGGLRLKGVKKASRSEQPLVSIFTVVYNGERYLEKTIQSVLNQTYGNIEYVLVDGGSTDGTLPIVRAYDDRIDYWISEPDKGIYDAMNKGLALVSGEIVGIINADDWYTPDAIAASVERLSETGADYACGMVRKHPSGHVVRPLYPLAAGKIYQGMIYPHIGAFIRREIYGSVGFFDTRYKIAADFDMALRIHLAGYRAVSVDRVVAELTEGGVSAGTASKAEYRDIALAHGKSRAAAYAAYLLQLAKFYAAGYLPKTLLRFVFMFKKSRFRSE